MSKWIGYPTFACIIFSTSFFFLAWPDKATTSAQSVDQVPLYYVIQSRLQYLRSPEAYMRNLRRAHKLRKQNDTGGCEAKHEDKAENDPANLDEDHGVHHRHHHHHQHHPHGMSESENEHENDAPEGRNKNHKDETEKKIEANNEKSNDAADQSEESIGDSMKSSDHREGSRQRRSPDDIVSTSTTEPTGGIKSWTKWIFGESAPEEALEEAEFVSSLLDESIGDEFQSASTTMMDTTDEMLQDVVQESSNLVRRRRSPDAMTSMSTSESTGGIKSWTKWIFGESAPEEALEEAEFVSSLLDESIGDEFQSTSTTMTDTTDEMLQDIVQESSNLVRRSPDERLLSSNIAANKDADVDRTTVINEETVEEQPSFWSRWFGAKPKTEDVQAAEQVSAQLNEDIVDELTLANPEAIRSSNTLLSRLFDYNSGLASKHEPTETELMTTTQEPSLYNTYLSPYAMLSYMLPEGETTDIAMNLLNLYNDPDNVSYWRTAVTFARIMLLFMPGAGIVEQVNFSIAMTQVLWKVSTMYYEGYSMTDIAVTVLPDIASAYLFRRDETFQAEYTLKPGETVDMNLMDTEKFVKFIGSMEFPPLLDSQEEEIRSEISNLVDRFFSRLSKRQKDTAIDHLINATKFFVLFNPVGDLRTSDMASSQQYFKDFKDVAMAVRNGVL